MFQQIVQGYLGRVDPKFALGVIAQLAPFDRYQASLGIERAAAIVAELASRAGAKNVTIERFPADGKARWWSFKAPTSWTPVVARLEAWAGSRHLVTIDHERQPFSVATYSADTGGRRRAVPIVVFQASMDQAGLQGALVVLDQAAFQQPGILNLLTERGAVGFVTTTVAPSPHGAAVGRVELDAETRLVGFSASAATLSALQEAARVGAVAHVEVCVDRSAMMPVVCGDIREGPPGESVLLTAHLCHPRPGANDNASGVAAVLGVAAVRGAKPPSSGRAQDRGLRFQCGPEFVGAAAMLHQALTAGDGTLPASVINFDMVGEDQGLCGGPFIVERCPDYLGSPINFLAEGVVEAVFDQTAAGGGGWRAAGFLGYSDHALYAARNIQRPAVQFCHYPDRFNHTSDDDLDKVSPLEMRRTIAAGAALGELLSRQRVSSTGDLQDATAAWAGRERSEARTIAARHRACDNGRWSEAFIDHVEGGVARTLETLDRGQLWAEEADGPSQSGGRQATWEGPLNVRGVMEALPVASRNRLRSMIAKDKFCFAILQGLGLHLNGRRDRSEVIQATSFSMRRPLSPDPVDELFDLLQEAGYVSPAEMVTAD